MLKAAFSSHSCIHKLHSYFSSLLLADVIFRLLHTDTRYFQGCLFFLVRLSGRQLSLLSEILPQISLPQGCWLLPASLFRSKSGFSSLKQGCQLLLLCQELISCHVSQFSATGFTLMLLLISSSQGCQLLSPHELPAATVSRQPASWAKGCPLILRVFAIFSLAATLSSQLPAISYIFHT